MSFYTSLSGLRNAQTELSVTAHNLANVETVGFKKSRVEFADVVAVSPSANPRLIIGIGAAVEEIGQNFANGPIEQTGLALDMSINGGGFFTTVAPRSGQTLYTRNGSFDIDAGGFIVDGDGNRLQLLPVDADGNTTSTTPQTITVPQNNAAGSEFVNLEVLDDGSVIASYADASQETFGRVALASFVAPTGLLQVGSSNWQATGRSGPPAYGAPGDTARFGLILSGSIERSNVDIAEELVNLITAQQAYQANAKAIETAGEITQTILNLNV